MATVKLEGFRELDRALGELPKATARNVLRRVLTKAAEPTLQAMKAKAPVADGPYYRWNKSKGKHLVQPGRTANSPGISIKLNPANRRDERDKAKSFGEVHVGSTRGSAAHFQEYGTANHPPRPYLRPAWEATKQGALKILERELGNEIEKAATRLARKRAKAGG